MQLFKKPSKDEANGRPIPARLQYGVKESAQMLGVSERTLASIISQNRIKSHKLGGRRMITRDNLTDFVEKLSSREVDNGRNS